ncbi:MAG: hypothetical protein QNJ64_16310 [Crocosphaera sp.]|nr:hypothetical protein [Crocosphaera sp.]
MVNSISVCANVKIHGKIARKPWAKLLYMCRTIDKKGSGRVKILIPEIIALLGISKGTFYRHLKEGKEAGAFRSYKRTDKYEETIYLGSLTEIAKNLKLTNWGSTTEIPLWMLLTCAEIPLWEYEKEKAKKIKAASLKKRITWFQTQWLEKQSIEAAKDQERQKIRNKRKRRKPYDPKFSGATGKPTSQIKAARKEPRFSRRHLPTGASQEGIGQSLEICDRTVRRHLEQIERMQIFYKVTAYEGQAELFHAQEENRKPLVFKRQGEYYRYGTNLYNLDFNQKSQFTGKLKYKYNLYKKKLRLGLNKDKFYLCKLSKSEILDEFKEFDLDPMDHICINVLIANFCKIRFKEFKELVIREIRETKKARSGRKPGR